MREALLTKLLLLPNVLSRIQIRRLKMERSNGDLRFCIKELTKSGMEYSK